MNPTVRRIGGYLLLGYLLSWTWWLPLALAHRVVHVGGWPTHLPGLLGPAVAALVVTAFATGRSGVRELARRIGRWRIGWWWLVAVSPLAFVGIGYAVRRPAGPDLWHINGFPLWGPLGTMVLLVVVNGLGEETGWRGFLQDSLQRRFRPLVAMLIVAAVWAAWHAPLFAILENFRGFSAATLVGFAIGLLSGAVVLGWLYNRTGSVLAVAVWHASYNLASATVAARGPSAALGTTVVIVGAVLLVVADIKTGGRILAPADISRRTTWTPVPASRTPGRSLPTVPPAPR